MSQVFVLEFTLFSFSFVRLDRYIAMKRTTVRRTADDEQSKSVVVVVQLSFFLANRTLCAVMVRQYKRRTEGPSYSKDDLAQAISMIKHEKWSYRRAGSHFKIPLGTLSSHIRSNPNEKLGHPTALSMSEEEYLVKLIMELQEWGQLSSCSDVLKYADEYVKMLNLQCRFTAKGPTKDWYYGFVRRWNEQLKLMKSSSLESSRATGVSKEIVAGWFAKLHDVLTKLDLLDKPQNIFNADESGFCEEAGSRVVLVKRDSKYAHQ